MSALDHDDGFLVVGSEDDRERPSAAAVCSASREKALRPPILIIEISLLTHMQRTAVPRDADATCIGQVLKDMILYRFNLFWHVRHGDFPKGRGFPVPILKVWDAPAHLERSEAKRLPPLYEAPLARIDHIVAAVEALCHDKPTLSELADVAQQWPNYRFNNLVFAQRRNLARLNERLARLEGQ